MAERTETPEANWLGDEKAAEILQEHLDETDYRIYRVLNENGRISDTELGERIGLSRTAVRRRREKLQEEGILDIIAVLVLQQAEFAYADVRVEYSTDATTAEIENFLTDVVNDDFVYEVDEYMGEFDLLVRIWHSSLSDIKDFLRSRFQQNSVVESYESTPVTKTHKAWHKVLDDSL